VSHDREAGHRALLAALGGAVRARRHAQGLSMRELGARAEVSERFLAQLEGGTGNISVARLWDVAGALGTTAAELLANGPTPGEAPRAGPRAGEGKHVLALLGLRGAGKTTLGTAAARRMGVPFVELDALVERAAGMSLRELFELHGTQYYRRVERSALGDFLARGERAVLATGGGLVTDHDTYAMLRRAAVTVWLRARPEDHFSRVVAQGDVRPMAERSDAMSDLRRLLLARRALYERADHVVNTSTLGVERSVRALLRVAP
jgi:XRE family aerobic/anaerobic benzoate catabolism transcriptional regulator